MNAERYDYQTLFDELAEFEKHGVRIKVNGEAASPLQVISAHLVKEAHSYMRDYIIGEDGDVEELCFQSIVEDK